MGRKYLARRLASFKALKDGETGEADGTFEAIVSVFGNVDRVGEMVMEGAFTDSLAEWEKRDRPIPVIFAHQWDNLDAHIGQVVKAEERDVGLYVKGALNIEEPFAAKVFRKLVDGTIAEFSFAYEEIEEGWADDVHELRKLDVLEVGPCLVGANPATQLLGVKDLGGKAGAQAIHDLAVNLGAKCGELDEGGDEEGDGDQGGGEKNATPRGPSPETLAARIGLELMAQGTQLEEG